MMIRHALCKAGETVEELAIPGAINKLSRALVLLEFPLSGEVVAFSSIGEELGTDGGPFSRARHFPETHEQLPPQSSVPGAHSAEHDTAAHSDHDDRAAHVFEWQQSAGPQSASLLHSSATVGDAVFRSNVRLLRRAWHWPAEQ